MHLMSGDCRNARAARIALVAVFAASVAVAGVFTMPPLDRDESRFAQATAQMLESGDYVSIRFQNDERNKKPAGVHWLQAASVAAFSPVEAREIWAYRIPSVIGAVFAALFTFAAGARLYGPPTALLAALLIASAPAVAGEATIAKTDAMLLAAVTAAQAAFIHIFADVVDGRRPPARWALLLWVAIGAGVLIKGPIILLVVGLTAAAMAVHRPRTDWIAALRPVTGAIICLFMLGPWAIAIHEATEGRFFTEAIGGDMLAKLGGARESHGGPPGYYSLVVFQLFWPAAALILPGVRNAVASRREWSSWFLLGWIVPALIIFELTPTKLPHYTLPLYPAIALLAARAAIDGAADRSIFLHRLGALIYVTVGLMIAGLIGALPILFQQDTVKTYGVVAAVAIGLASIATGILYWRRRSVEATVSAVLVSAAAAWALLNGVLPHLGQLALSPRISAAIDAAGLHPLKDAAVPAVLSGYHEPSAVFLLGTETALTDGASAADLFLKTPRAAVIESREDVAFRRRLSERGADAERFARIEGVNYSNGDAVVLNLYRRSRRSSTIGAAQ